MPTKQESANPLVRKIAKMLALAADQSGKPEGETAARLADKLMREYAVSMADVDALDLTPDPLTEDTLETGRVRWRNHLAWTLATHCNLEAVKCKVRTPGRGSNSAKMRLFGFESDIEVYKYLYDICERQIEQQTKDWLKGFPKGTIKYGQNMAFRESMVQGLLSKLREIREAGEAENPQSTALVLSRKERAKVFAHEKMDSIVYRSGPRHSLNMEGFQRGRKITLNKGVNGNAAPTRQLN